MLIIPTKPNPYIGLVKNLVINQTVSKSIKTLNVLSIPYLLEPYFRLRWFTLISLILAKIKEIKVNHRSRKYGSSKYGIDRTFRVLMDLLTVWFMTKFLTRPMYGFGFVGIISILVSLGMTSYLFIIKLLGNDIGNRPMLMFALILGIAGVQLFSFGLLGELLIRTYHESQNRPIYRIRKIQSISNE